MKDCDTGRNCALYGSKGADHRQNRERNGIGTLSEKTVHAVLKHYYAPDESQHEIPVEGCVADIFNGKEIIEIQTRSFDRMRPKLERFLPLYPVTIVYPIPYCKHVYWIDEETGEISGGRKSPLREVLIWHLRSCTGSKRICKIRT